MSKVKIQAVRGMHDVLAPEIYRWQWVEEKARSIFSRYGYAEIRTPIVEPTELFSRSIGEVSDIVEKEMYTFADRKGQSLTLRPEGTASVVRALMEAGLLQADPAGTSPLIRTYYLGPMFRHERPQKGRQRQFYQIGAEVLGDASARLDAELLALCHSFLNELGLSSHVRLEINSLGSKLSRPKFMAALTAHFEPHRSELCGDCQRRLEKNPMRLLDCKVESCRKIAADAPTILNFLAPEDRKHFDSVLHDLQTLDIPHQVNERIVRGLDYYTRTAFEFVTTDLGAQGTVLAGGRYDQLVSDLGGPEVPALGFAAGLERLCLLVELTGKAIADPSRAQIYLATLGEEAGKFGFHLLQLLRDLGLRCQCDFRDRSLKAHLRQADRLAVDYCVVIGTDELAKKFVLLKSMKQGTQREIPFENPLELSKELHERLTKG